ncbi:MAG: UbiA prenyltransferase family protein [Phycisphaerae bacterium]|nr:UbiA prenyltransferase family protein [Phycisphaerae bacterium]MBN8598773.1 UbiA prenyltransferase family protein [Planctomycetota bacterium]
MSLNEANSGGGEHSGGVVGVGDYVRLLRPVQWAKSVFVLIGPAYGYANGDWNPWLVERGTRLGLQAWVILLLAVIAFSLASSACYIVNDILDAPADRHHPRKKNRPIASGRVSVGGAIGMAALLVAMTAGSLLLMGGWRALYTAGIIAVYVLNVNLYSAILKHIVIADVISLSMGFVLRVLAGCAAVSVTPTTWLLNTTFFLAMFLAFGKRLGERRSLGSAGAAAARGVQAGYTDELLRQAVVVTAVVTLMTYAIYVQSQDAKYMLGFNLMWLTVLPATYAMLRAIVLLERGTFDDPTELASKDRPFQVGAVVFGLMTLGLMAGRHWHWIGSQT